MTAALSFHSVTKSFKQHPGYFQLKSLFATPRKIPFENFCVEVRPGEKILVLGPNGSGKTTLLKLAAGLIDADKGRILANGAPIRKAHRSAFGIMLSTQFLYRKLTGWQNLELNAALYGCTDSRGRIHAAAREWDLGGYLHQRVDSYSNGMKAMLALARATLHAPSILLLDEPTAYLNADNKLRLVNYLKRSEATILIATHQAEGFAGAFDRTIEL